MVLIVAFLGMSAACSSSGKPDAAATFHVQGSVNQVTVTDAKPGSLLDLLDAKGSTVTSGKADALGSYLFRNVPTGPGYQVRQPGTIPTRSGDVTVMTDRPAPPNTKIYNQTLPTGFNADGTAKKLGGYGYFTTRDGTKLAVNVRLPGPADKGPYPTVVEYSGYAYAKPGAAASSVSPIWNLFGYAVVDVNMRGTGCSGGAFDFFEPLQNLDGYDAIETVARQPWVMNHKVGMVGISYGGISQLFVAQTNPPDLGAITPASVIEGVTTTLYPGGILNTGFALTWAQERDSDAKPASPTTGQPWAWQQIKNGDTTCKTNQKLHGQAVNLVETTRKNTTYVAAIVDPLTPSLFVHKIKMPTYLACQWEDEQTGGACALLADKFTGNDKVWMTFTNGAHVDSLDPQTLQRDYDLLELYVAKRKPDLGLRAGLAPAIYQAEMKVPGVTLPADPIQAEPTYAAALSAFNALPRFQVLFDNGTGSPIPGAPVPGFEQSWPKYPMKELTPTSYYLGPNGTLTTTKPSASGSNSFVWDPKARPTHSMDAKSISDVWTALPNYVWAPLAPGKALAYATPPLAQNVTLIGGAALDVWMQSSAPDTDLQVTVSEIRPDGQELFVQNGWLRASYRKLNKAKSTVLTPYPSGTKADLAPLPKGTWSLVQIPIYAQGHVYRAGSRIRVSVEAPGGDQPQWSFDVLKPSGTVTNSIAFSPSMPSRLVLPMVAGVVVPTPLPASCPGMRAEPCRTYVEFTNARGPAVKK